MLLHRSKGENAYHKKERVCPLNKVIQTILKIHSLSIFYSRLVAVVRKRNAVRTTRYQPWVSKRFCNISFPELKKNTRTVRYVMCIESAQFRGL